MTVERFSIQEVYNICLNGHSDCWNCSFFLLYILAHCMTLELEMVCQEKNVWYSVLVMKQLYLTAVCRGNRSHCQADCSLSG